MGYVYEESLHPTAWTAEMGVRFLETWKEAKRGKTSDDAAPFFFKLSFHRPHSPYDPPARWLNKMLTKTDEIPAPANASVADVDAWDSIYIESSKCNATHEICGDGCGV